MTLGELNHDGPRRPLLRARKRAPTAGPVAPPFHEQAWFAPTDASHEIALDCLRVLTDRLEQAGITAPRDVALVRGLISGLASEQIANNPGGRDYVAQVGRGIRLLLRSLDDGGGRKPNHDAADAMPR